MLPPAVDFDDSPSWIKDPKFHEPRLPGDPRCRRNVMVQLQVILSLRHGHRPFRWGYAIIRTAYGPGSDEQFQKVIAILSRVAQVRTANEAKGVKDDIMYDKQQSTNLDHISDEVDIRPNEEFLRRLENDIIDDKKIMAKNGTDLAGDMRFAACIMIDTEILYQFATTPEEFLRDSEEGYASSYWLKLVDAETIPDEAVRVRVYGEDDFIKYWFERNLRRLPMSDLTHRYDDENPGVLYFGHARPRTMPKISLHGW
ncbi:hypothetical protein FLAG1_10424 [Fusarium langsethiae]|uniref:Uncharacterized protein n=1 Tax=Fusarium langsethiae TaxID=179993 RepID=A0A0M9EP83_FUSLA|nr:hypothetical protein FLAG1_10424 [Fusarium langsethiae]GKU07889.1 unnamed protein product [Fusarium langsethiae]GKU22538.1 unnamed protein product [Fusarium langsethiae]